MEVNRKAVAVVAAPTTKSVDAIDWTRGERA